MHSYLTTLIHLQQLFVNCFDNDFVHLLRHIVLYFCQCKNYISIMTQLRIERGYWRYTAKYFCLERSVDQLFGHLNLFNLSTQIDVIKKVLASLTMVNFTLSAFNRFQIRLNKSYVLFTLIYLI